LGDRSGAEGEDHVSGAGLLDDGIDGGGEVGGGSWVEIRLAAKRLGYEKA
jgi:hypothetical protein